MGKKNKNKKSKVVQPEVITAKVESVNTVEEPKIEKNDESKIHLLGAKDDESEINLLGPAPGSEKTSKADSKDSQDDSKDNSNKNLLVAQLYKVEADMAVETKKFQLQSQILKMKQSELSEKVQSEGMEHSLAVVKLERAILKLKQKNKEISEKLATKDYQLSTQAFPGELKAKLNMELDKTLEDLEECQKEYSVANAEYESKVLGLTVEKEELLAKYKKINDDHSAKMDIFDKKLGELRKEFDNAGIKSSEKKEKPGNVKSTKRGRRIPKGKLSTKNEALASIKEK